MESFTTNNSNSTINHKYTSPTLPHHPMEVFRSLRVFRPELPDRFLPFFVAGLEKGKEKGVVSRGQIAILLVSRARPPFLLLYWAQYKRRKKRSGSRDYYFTGRLSLSISVLFFTGAYTVSDKRPVKIAIWQGVVTHIAPVEPFGTGIKLFDH